MQKCPQDLSCVVKNIQRSPRIPGNIAVIVQLLHNISTMLSTDVGEAKMKVSGLEHLWEVLGGGGEWERNAGLVGAFEGLRRPCLSLQYFHYLVNV